MSDWLVVWPIQEKGWKEPEVEGPPHIRALSSVALIDRWEPTDEDGKPVRPEFHILPQGFTDDAGVRCWRFLIVKSVWQAIAAAGWKGAGQPQPEENG